ncbi:MAG TPA: hypothetical protein H9675_05375 [Firmicutes bacterium]|nr:hypothetical protein [Bacillota bacterium]
MAKIQIKRGDKNSLPLLAPGEFGLADDTDELFIGGNAGNLQIPIMGEGVTVLFSGTLTGGNFAQLSESIYNFQFIAVKPSSGPDILIPVLPEAKSVAGSVSISVPEAFDTYMFAADIGTDGKLLGDNQNVKVTTVLGNPAQTIYSVYNVTAIYGICRIKSD